MKKIQKIFALAVLSLGFLTVSAQNDYFKDFPVGAKPEIVGKKLSNRLMETKHHHIDFIDRFSKFKGNIIYRFG